MNKLKRVLASLITLVMFFAVSPIAAHAEWQQSSNGWWYTEGSSYATGWRLIDGNWYYFYSDGYMAKNTTIDDYYLNSDGAWTTSIPASSSISYNNSNSSSGSTQYVDANGNGLIKGSVDYIYHIPGSTYYNKTKNVVQWFKSVEEAEAAGYRAPEK